MRFQASYFSVKPDAGEAGWGIVVMLPALSYSGSAQFVPVLAVMDAPGPSSSVLFVSISLTELCVRLWFRSVVPLVLATKPDQLPSWSSVQVC